MVFRLRSIGMPAGGGRAMSEHRNDAGDDDLQRLDRPTLHKILVAHQRFVTGQSRGCRALLSFHDLSDQDLSGRNLAEADPTGAVLQRALLPGAILRKANLDNADLSRADLRGVCFRGALLRGARLIEAEIR